MSDRAPIKIGFLSMPLTGHLNPMTPEEIGSLPSNAIVVNNAPQLEILHKTIAAVRTNKEQPAKSWLLFLHRRKRVPIFMNISIVGSGYVGLVTCA